MDARVLRGCYALNVLAAQTVHDVDQMVSEFLAGGHLALYTCVNYAFTLTFEPDRSILPANVP